jgi:AcrR family transcriptional regulator
MANQVANKPPTPKPLPRGRNRLPADEVLARQKERLIAAMTHAAAERGYHATTVTEVAALARVTRPVFYRAFPGGKEDCFLAAYEAATDQLLKSAIHAHDRAGGQLTGIESALRAVTTEMAHKPDIARLCLIEITALGPTGLKHRDQTLRRGAEVLQKMIEDSQGHRPLSKTKVQALVGGCHQLLYLAVADGRTAELPKLVPDMLYMILAFRLGPKAATQPTEPPARP